MHRIGGAVVVITGASGGIGRATAHAFAREGAALVLAARRPAALEDALQECRRLGGRGIAVPTDVADADAVERLCGRALEAFGRIDVWVNNAAVSLFGRIDEAPREVYVGVLRTNLIGTVNGCRAAVRQFRAQGSGRLVNISSVVGHVGQPYTSAYAASKWAIRGLSESLRMELADAPGITVTTVLPAAVDTPIFQHAANYTGRPVKAMTPVYPPEQVARAVVRAVRAPRREVFVGSAGRAIALLRTLAPKLGERLMRRQVETDHFAGGPPVPASAGNVDTPAAGRGAVRGGWIARENARAPTASLATAAVAAALTLALLYAGGRRRR